MSKSDLNNELIEFISEQDRRDFDVMVRKVRENYLFYNMASYELKKEYRFINESIISCLSKVNNQKRLSTGLKELRAFLSSVNKYSENIYKATINETQDGKTLVVKDVNRPKMKVKTLFNRVA